MHGHRIGFDVAPVKVSRRDAVNIVTMGEETDHATPVVLLPRPFGTESN